MYNDLSLRERAAIIKTAIHNGYRNLPDIVDAYNKFAEGGPKELPEVEVTARLHTPVDIRDNSNFIRERLYNNIEPKSYDDMASRVSRALMGINTRTGEVTPELEAYWAYYMQLNPELVSLYLEKSPLRPTKGSAKYETVVRPKAGISDLIFNAAVLNIPLGSNMLSSLLFPDVSSGLGDYTIGHGLDENGKYISIYDDWDLSTGAHNTGDMSLGIGTPFTVYDRRYYK